jgi:hypothetical protein
MILKKRKLPKKFIEVCIIAVNMSENRSRVNITLK